MVQLIDPSNLLIRLDHLISCPRLGSCRSCSAPRFCLQANWCRPSQLESELSTRKHRDRSQCTEGDAQITGYQIPELILLRCLTSEHLSKLSDWNQSNLASSCPCCPCSFPRIDIVVRLIHHPVWKIQFDRMGSCHHFGRCRDWALVTMR